MLDARLALVSVSYLLAGVSAICIASLVAFYVLELPAGATHVFGPVSDLTTSLWNILVVPLVVASAPVLSRRSGRVLVLVTAVLSVGGAAMSMLLVTDTVNFGVATPVSVLAVLAQGAWAYGICLVWRRMGGPTGVTTLGRLVGVGVGVGALLVGVSFAFSWMSLPQLVVMGLGLVPGVLAWASWPIWFCLVGRAAQRATWSRPSKALTAAAWGG